MAPPQTLPLLTTSAHKAAQSQKHKSHAHRHNRLPRSSLRAPLPPSPTASARKAQHRARRHSRLPLSSLRASSPPLPPSQQKLTPPKLRGGRGPMSVKRTTMLITETRYGFFQACASLCFLFFFFSSIPFYKICQWCVRSFIFISTYHFYIVALCYSSF